MKPMLQALCTGLSLSLALGVGGCLAPAPPVPAARTMSALPLTGSVTFDAAGRLTQAEMSELGNAATVSLIDATSGNTLGSSVTDASGNFVLTFDTLIPSNGSTYVLEAVKGLSVGGNPNRAGASAVRVRTLLMWENGWKSLTNSTPGSGIVVSAATTALSTIVSLKKTAGTTITLSALMGKIDSSNSSFNDGGTGLSAANDFTPVLGLVQSAIQLDQDPVGGVALDSDKGLYSLVTGLPLISSISPSVPNPGDVLTIKGANFDRLDGRNALWFGTVPAATWSVNATKTTLTVPVPATAYSAPFLLQQPGGVTQVLHSFLKIRGTVGTLAGNGVASFGDGTGINAQFQGPLHLAFDAAGNLFASDYVNHRIRKVTPAGAVTTFAGSGNLGGMDGTGTAAQFNRPYGVTTDAAGNVYVAEYLGNRIRKITAAGVVSTLAGDGTGGTTDGTGTGARFTNPTSLSADAAGNVYVADYVGNRIRKVDPGGVVTTVAGNTSGYLDGTGTGALFASPVSVALDGSGNLYVADNHRIRKIVLGTGVVSTVAGNATAASTDGTGTAASFNGPVGMAFDGLGNLYVGEYNGSKIRKLALSTGVVTTVAFTGTAGYLDGALGSAQCNRPYGLAFDASGNLYIGDASNYRLRVLTP